MAVSKTIARQKWLARLEALVTAARPDSVAARGRMDWDTAMHFWYTGYAPEEACARYVAMLDRETKTN